jgi:hypothetical protein
MRQSTRRPFDLTCIGLMHVLLLPASAAATLWWAASAVSALLSVIFGLSSCWLGLQLFRLRPRARVFGVARALGFICAGVLTSHLPLLVLGVAGFCYFMSARMFDLFRPLASAAPDRVYSNGFERFLAEMRERNEVAVARSRALLSSAETAAMSRREDVE